GLDLASEGLEPLAPEFIEERAQLTQALRAGSVDASRALAALAQETRVVQDPQVLRDRLPCDVEVRGDRSRGHFVVADEMQDLASSGLGDGIDGCLHGNVSIYYRNLTLAPAYAYILPSA